MMGASQVKSQKKLIFFHVQRLNHLSWLCEMEKVIETELYKIHYFDREEDDDDDYKPEYWPDVVSIKLNDDVELCFYQFHKIKLNLLKNIQTWIKLSIEGTLGPFEKMTLGGECISVGDESGWGGWELTCYDQLFCLEMYSKCGSATIKINIPYTNNHVIIFDMLAELAAKIEQRIN